MMKYVRQAERRLHAQIVFVAVIVAVLLGHARTPGVYAASITASINWSAPTGRNANLQFGLNTYNGYSPSI